MAVLHKAGAGFPLPHKGQGDFLASETIHG